MKIVFFLFLVLFGCNQTRQGIKEEFLPKARGEADEIIIVVDSAQWADRAGVGGELKKTFLQPMLGLPQDEPLFNVSKVSPRKLNSVLKSANNMVFVTTLDSRSADSRTLQKYYTDQSLNQIKRDTSNFMRINKDLFAKGQTVMFLHAATAQLLAKKINYNREQIREFFESSAKEKIKQKLSKSQQKDMKARLRESHNAEILIPYGWEKGRESENFIWYRKMDAQTEQSLFIYYEPYTSQNIFNDIGSFRDKITRTNLYDGENQEVYIMRQEIINVFTQRMTFNNHFAMEARSLWKISDGSRGGPFVSYTIVDEDSGLVYYIEGYVDSPGTKKKQFVRELEAILSTFKTQSDLSSTS